MNVETRNAQFHFWDINRILFAVWETYTQQRTQLQLWLFFETMQILD